MLEDKLLIWKLNHGSADALCRIYEKYRDDLVRIAAGLLNNMSVAEDVVQEVFLTLVRSAGLEVGPAQAAVAHLVAEDRLHRVAQEWIGRLLHERAQKGGAQVSVTQASATTS